VKEIPLAHHLRLPLRATEQWLSLIAHQVKITAHNMKVLLKQHVPIQTHVRNMRQIARYYEELEKLYNAEELDKHYEEIL